MRTLVLRLQTCVGLTHQLAQLDGGSVLLCDFFKPNHSNRFYEQTLLSSLRGTFYTLVTLNDMQRSLPQFKRIQMFGIFRQKHIIKVVVSYAKLIE